MQAGTAGRPFSGSTRTAWAAVGKIEGVESVEVSLERAVAEIRLGPGEAAGIFAGPSKPNEPESLTLPKLVQVN